MCRVESATVCRQVALVRAIIFAACAAGATPAVAAEVSWTENTQLENKVTERTISSKQFAVDTDTNLPLAGLSSDQRFLDSIKSLLRDHPALLALESEQLALFEGSQTTLALPDPVVSVGINNLSISSPSFDEFLPTNKSIGIRQEFPNLKGRSAKADQALAQSKTIDFMIVAKRESLIADVLEHLIQKHSLERQIGLATERLQKYNELTEVVQSEIEAGNPSVFRLAEIDAERARVSGLINNLSAQNLEHDAQLIALTGRVPNLEIPAFTIRNSEDFHTVRIAQAQLDSVSESLNIADASRFKRWGVQLAYQQRENGNTFKGDDWVSGQVFFTAPLWYRQSQAPEKRAAIASVEAARQKLLLAQRTALAEHTALTARHESSAASISLLKREISAVQDKIETQTTSYEAGIGYFAPIVDGDIALLKLHAQIVAENAARDTYRVRLNSLLIGNVSHE